MKKKITGPVKAGRNILLRMSMYCMVLMVLLMALSSCKEDSDEEEIVVTPPEEVVDNDITDITKKLMAGTGLIKKFKTDTLTNLADGLSLTKLSYTDQTDMAVSMFILEADLKNPKLTMQALLPYNDYLNGLQRLSEMCRDNQKSATKIMAAINGDFYSTAGLPDGYFYIDGIGLRTARTTASKAYFALLKDKTPVIGGLDPLTGTEVPGITLTNIQHAIGGRQWLVKDAQVVPSTDVSSSAKTALGYTSSNIVYAVVVDGDQEEYSMGMGLGDLSKVMLTLGTVRAINLSGGTSSTMVVGSGSSDMWSVKNHHPKNFEATVANGWGFVVAN